MNNSKHFESKQLRAVWNEADEKWYYVIADIVELITNNADARDTIKGMRKRKKEFADAWRQIAKPLIVKTTGGKQLVYCTNVNGIRCIIKYLPSKKARPYIFWIAQFDAGITYLSNTGKTKPGLLNTSGPLYRVENYRIEESGYKKSERKFACQDMLDQFEQKLSNAKNTKENVTIQVSDFKKLIPPQTHTFSDQLMDFRFIFSMFSEVPSLVLVKVNKVEYIHQSKTRELQKRKLAADARKALE